MAPPQCRIRATGHELGIRHAQKADANVQIVCLCSSCALTHTHSLAQHSHARTTNDLSFCHRVMTPNSNCVLFAVALHTHTIYSFFFLPFLCCAWREWIWTHFSSHMYVNCARSLSLCVRINGSRQRILSVLVVCIWRGGGKGDGECLESTVWRIQIK